MGYHGELWWYNEKPFLSVREAMWDLTSLEPLAQRINSSAINASNVEGYTLIIVHAWSHDYDDVKTLVNMFDDHVEVILPGQMLELINQNVEKVNAKP
ncbi:hypothetical protein KHQ89_05915 [Mycoplasmatota bacterium]|nr:hypothetical protein KHQ89_05915 [Mycoplasmatota bacterium]